MEARWTYRRTYRRTYPQEELDEDDLAEGGCDVQGGAAVVAAVGRIDVVRRAVAQDHNDVTDVFTHQRINQLLQHQTYTISQYTISQYTISRSCHAPQYITATLNFSEINNSDQTNNHLNITVPTIQTHLKSNDRNLLTIYKITFSQ